MSDVLRSEDNKPEIARLSTHGDEGYVHVSSLIGFCARQYAIAGRSEEQHVNKVTGGHRVMWEIGRAVEKHVRNQFIKAMDRRYLFGQWTCQCNRLQRVGYYADDGVACSTCGTSAETYREQPMKDDAAKIIGSCDMPVLVGQRILPVEIKSTDKTQEELLAMTGPMPDHIFQVSGYHRLYTLNNIPVHPFANILYVQKRFKFGNPYREFQVRMNDRQVVADLDRAWEGANDLVAAQSGNRLPPRICTAPTLSRAKKCAVMGHCFNARG